jgi:hypothetical protein
MFDWSNMYSLRSSYVVYGILDWPIVFDPIHLYATVKVVLGVVRDNKLHRVVNCLWCSGGGVRAGKLLQIHSGWGIGGLYSWREESAGCRRSTYPRYSEPDIHVSINIVSATVDEGVRVFYPNC